MVYAESESDVDKSDTDVATKPKLNGKGELPHSPRRGLEKSAHAPQGAES